MHMVHQVILQILNVHLVLLALQHFQQLVIPPLGHVLVQTVVLLVSHVQLAKQPQLFVVCLGVDQYLVVLRSQLIKHHQ